MERQMLISKYFNFLLSDGEIGEIDGILKMGISQTENEIIVEYQNYYQEYFLNKKIPISIKIYDFSKALQKKKLKTRADYQNAFKEQRTQFRNYTQTFELLGEDVTDSFGDLLRNLQPSSSTSTTVTKTTTKNENTNLDSPNGMLKVEQIQGESDVTGKLIKSTPFSPKEFLGGILDNSINPAFSVEKIAKVFANHLKNLNYENGQMVGVFGKWGRGKTYFINEVCKHLNIDFEKESSEAKSDFVFIKFQAWKYQTTPSTWAYLFETIIDKYLDVKWYKKPMRIIRFSLIRKGHWNSWVKPLLGILLCAIWFILVPWVTQNSTIIEAGKWAGGIGAILIITNKIASILKLLNKPAIKLFDSLTKIPSFKSVLGIQAEVQKELVFLIKAFSQVISNKRILLFIDDLDRCSEDSMIEIVDALRVILDDSEINRKIIVLVAVDESKLKKAIEFKYKERRTVEELRDISKEYIDKLFISALKLPSISPKKFGDFIESIANQVNYPDGKKIEIQIDDKINISDEVVADENRSTELDEVQETKKPAKSETTIESTIKLTEKEISLLKEKLSSVSFELTPRQIRIVFFRYLLARNLWIELSKKSDFEIETIIEDIINQTLSANIDKNPDRDELYDEIVQMVVAY